MSEPRRSSRTDEPGAEGSVLPLRQLGRGQGRGSKDGLDLAGFQMEIQIVKEKLEKDCGFSPMTGMSSKM